MSRRLIVVAALAAGVVAVVALARGAGDGGYVVKARFTDGSQLVTGDLVEVGGRKVGTVSTIDLTDENFAEVTMRLDDESVEPLHLGTRAVIRTLGLSGVANRFIDLRPGPDTTPAIPDGGILPPTHTQGVVDLDALLNGLDPAVRRDVQGLIRDAAVALTSTSARQANAGLRFLNPAVSQLTALGRELTRDQAALAGLIEHTAAASGVLARHRDALGGGIDATAGVLEAVGSQRERLADALEHAPAGVRATMRTLRRLRTRTLPTLDPVLRDARPAAAPAAELLRLVGPTLEDARPVLAGIERLVPQSRAALSPLPAMRRAALPAMASITEALRDALPIARGLRPYTPDLVSGFFHGFGGSTAHSYDANGHYARIMLGASDQTAAGLSARPPTATRGGLRTGLDARCPGAAEEPAPDGSNPWPEGVNGGGADVCDPEDNR